MSLSCQILNLLVASFISTVHSAPVNLDAAVPSTALVPALISLVFLICVILFAVGCLCCHNKGIKSHGPENGIPLPQHSNSNSPDSIPGPDSEFTIFPPPHSSLKRGLPSSHQDDGTVTFEPLPDIRLKKFSSPINSAHHPRPPHFHTTINQGFSFNDWFDEPHGNFPRSQLQYLSEMGSGWFGQVVRGEAQQIVTNSNKVSVIVKILREDASPSEHMYFLHEVRWMRDLEHNHLLKMLGRCLESDPFLVILEHCSLDLKSYLVQQRVQSEPFLQGGQMLRMACHVAQGLQHMHQAKFYHTDLAARNCLVTAEQTVKIGDYGTGVRTYNEDYYVVGGTALPIRWCSPELLLVTETTIDTKEVTQESNIWSFGVLLWEMLELGKLPYIELSDEEVLQKVVLEQQTILEQPKTPCIHREQLWQVMCLCWNHPENRPAIQKLMFMLDHLFDNKDISSDSAAFESRWNVLQPVLREHNIEPVAADPLGVTLTFESNFVSQPNMNQPPAIRLTKHRDSDFDISSIRETSSSRCSLSASFEANFGASISPSLQNLRGSLDDLSSAILDNRDHERSAAESKTKKAMDEQVTDEQITEAIRELDDYLAGEVTSSEVSKDTTPERNQSQEDFFPNQKQMPGSATTLTDLGLEDATVPNFCFMDYTRDAQEPEESIQVKEKERRNSLEEKSTPAKALFEELVGDQIRKFSLESTSNKVMDKKRDSPTIPPLGNSEGNHKMKAVLTDWTGEEDTVSSILPEMEVSPSQNGLGIDPVGPEECSLDESPATSSKSDEYVSTVVCPVASPSNGGFVTLSPLLTNPPPESCGLSATSTDICMAALVRESTNTSGCLPLYPLTNAELYEQNQTKLSCDFRSDENEKRLLSDAGEGLGCSISNQKEPLDFNSKTSDDEEDDNNVIDETSESFDYVEFSPKSNQCKRLSLEEITYLQQSLSNVVDSEQRNVLMDNDEKKVVQSSVLNELLNASEIECRESDNEISNFKLNKHSEELPKEDFEEISHLEKGPLNQTPKEWNSQELGENLFATSTPTRRSLSFQDSFSSALDDYHTALDKTLIEDLDDGEPSQKFAFPVIEITECDDSTTEFHTCLEVPTIVEDSLSENQDPIEETLLDQFGENDPDLCSTEAINQKLILEFSSSLERQSSSERSSPLTLEIPLPLDESDANVFIKPKLVKDEIQAEPISEDSLDALDDTEGEQRPRLLDFEDEPLEDYSLLRKDLFEQSNPDVTSESFLYQNSPETSYINGAFEDSQPTNFLYSNQPSSSLTRPVFFHPLAYQNQNMRFGAPQNTNNYRYHGSVGAQEYQLDDILAGLDETQDHLEEHGAYSTDEAMYQQTSEDADYLDDELLIIDTETNEAVMLDSKERLNLALEEENLMYLERQIYVNDVYNPDVYYGSTKLESIVEEFEGSVDSSPAHSIQVQSDNQSDDFKPGQSVGLHSGLDKESERTENSPSLYSAIDDSLELSSPMVNRLNFSSHSDLVLEGDEYLAGDNTDNERDGDDIEDDSETSSGVVNDEETSEEVESNKSEDTANLLPLPFNWEAIENAEELKVRYKAAFEYMADELIISQDLDDVRQHLDSNISKTNSDVLPDGNERAVLDELRLKAELIYKSDNDFTNSNSRAEDVESKEFEVDNNLSEMERDDPNADRLEVTDKASQDYMVDQSDCNTSKVMKNKCPVQVERDEEKLNVDDDFKTRYKAMLEFMADENEEPEMSMNSFEFEAKPNKFGVIGTLPSVRLEMDRRDHDLNEFLPRYKEAEECKSVEEIRDQALNVEAMENDHSKIERISTFLDLDVGKNLCTRDTNDLVESYKAAAVSTTEKLTRRDDFFEEVKNNNNRENIVTSLSLEVANDATKLIAKSKAAAKYTCDEVSMEEELVAEPDQVQHIKSASVAVSLGLAVEKDPNVSDASSLIARYKAFAECTLDEVITEDELFAESDRAEHNKSQIIATTLGLDVEKEPRVLDADELIARYKAASGNIVDEFITKEELFGDSTDIAVHNKSESIATSLGLAVEKEPNLLDAADLIARYKAAAECTPDEVIPEDELFAESDQVEPDRNEIIASSLGLKIEKEPSVLDADELVARYKAASESMVDEFITEEELFAETDQVEHDKSQIIASALGLDTEKEPKLMDAADLIARYKAAAECTPDEVILEHELFAESDQVELNRSKIIASSLGLEIEKEPSALDADELVARYKAASESMVDDFIIEEELFAETDQVGHDKSQIIATTLGLDVEKEPRVDADELIARYKAASLNTADEFITEEELFVDSSMVEQNKSKNIATSLGLAVEKEPNASDAFDLIAKYKATAECEFEEVIPENELFAEEDQVESNNHEACGGSLTVEPDAEELRARYKAVREYIETELITDQELDAEEVETAEFFKDDFKIHLSDKETPKNKLEGEEEDEQLTSFMSDEDDDDEGEGTDEEKPKREGVYTPDFESDTDDTSSTGTSDSSTSGSFDCPDPDGDRFGALIQEGDCEEGKETVPVSPVKIFSTAWDCKLTPTKSAIKSPEKKKVHAENMKKSVSFHEEEGPAYIFCYPPESESEDEEMGLEDASEFSWHVDYTNYADWEVQPLDDEEVSANVMDQDDEEDFAPPTPSSSSSVRQPLSLYSISGLLDEDLLDSLESQNNNYPDYTEMMERIHSDEEDEQVSRYAAAENLTNYNFKDRSIEDRSDDTNVISALVRNRTHSSLANSESFEESGIDPGEVELNLEFDSPRPMLDNTPDSLDMELCTPDDTDPLAQILNKNQDKTGAELDSPLDGNYKLVGKETIKKNSLLEEDMNPEEKYLLRNGNIYPNVEPCNGYTYPYPEPCNGDTYPDPELTNGDLHDFEGKRLYPNCVTKNNTENLAKRNNLSS